MKKVVEKQENRVFVGEVSLSNYYGVKAINCKGFITRERFNSGCYRILCTQLLTCGNGFLCSKETTSLTEFIKYNLSSYEVFEFDTPQELFKWLSE